MLADVAAIIGAALNSFHLVAVYGINADGKTFL